MRFNYRGWVADVDVDATRNAYAKGHPGASVECGCDECANFIAARDSGYVYPVAVAKLLTDMGVDLARESEVFVAGSIGRGNVVYGGWFNVAGVLVSDEEGSTEVEPGFDLFPLPEGAVVDDAFGEEPVFRIEFRVLVPWMQTLKRKK
ncbi:MAG: hypothetical protein HGB10_09550 [Coriobacteriia bacterium]|nr:hypothetical protein [Coriobacteriia bacterium]